MKNPNRVTAKARAEKEITSFSSGEEIALTKLCPGGVSLSTEPITGEARQPRSALAREYNLSNQIP